MVLVILVAVVLAALAVTALRRGVEPPVAVPVPTRSPAASVPPTPSLGLGLVCTPVTAGPSSLDVSFSLRNMGGAPVDLVSVEPELPLAGLLERGYTIHAGQCPATGATLTDDRLGRARPVRVPPAGWVVATLHFALPPTCPDAYPVLAVVTETADSGALTIATHYPLLADLGGVKFASC